MLHRTVKMIIIKITKVMTFFNNKFTLNVKQKPNAIFKNFDKKIHNDHKFYKNYDQQKLIIERKRSKKESNVTIE